MFFVYVLSNSAGRHYTGSTADLVERIRQHNEGLTRSTKGRGPWTLLYREQFATRSEAIHREKFLKTGKGREELESILQARSSNVV